MSEKKSGAGRPTKYNPELNETVTNYCLLGATDEDLARFLSVDVSTIHRWKNEHQEFCDAIKRGKEDADAQVVRSLYKRALGYEYVEVKKETSDNGVKDTKTTRVIVPDTTAQIFWLKNRQPKLWRDKQELDHTSSDGSMSAPKTINLVAKE